ncbi:2,3-butanediol dehydrogenase [Cytobacillus purgationiresistens]|uniref:(R,R)-butanediol dehydrogenase/meso-butanediol dehydrogenase/diacetyl reductase n=1 Tax=Cytobacillus purgationiresistens TaxID=863449 RepID=A0ABU0AK61_9BACI|nr:2,3-butanediol dehydrogenase [Cytobacillus purgationiresistens]MDQ0271661.1 (R,R)-butanediol dehydrogenase/meso-butanediol dehydrogenase/diacetyl reductase [Cytobacillus purgationiresistens]
MKAAVWHDIKDVRIEQIEEPVVSSSQIKVKVEWTGICGSDLHAYAHGLSKEAHPISGQKPPITLGHEFSGTIVELGEDVSGHQVGERVAIEPLIYCGECYACKRGYYNQCNQVGFVGLNRDGGFAEYVVVDENMVHVLPDNVSFEEGALVEPAAVSFYAVRESKLKAGDSVAIFGAGPIGLLTLLSAKAAGATQMIVVDLSEERLKKAKELGATTIINGSRDDIAATILQLTNGGVNVAYEAAGVQPTMTNAVASVRQGGQVMAIAVYSKPVSIDMGQIMFKAADITSTLAYRHIFPEVIDMIATGRLDVKQVITKKIQLDDLIDQGFNQLTNDVKQAKILVKPTNN